MSNAQSVQPTQKFTPEQQERFAQARILHQRNITDAWNDLKQSPTLRLFIVNEDHEFYGDVSIVTSAMAIGNILDSMVLFDDYDLFVQTEANNLYALSNTYELLGKTTILNICKINPDSKNSTFPEPNPTQPLVTGAEFLNTLKAKGYVSLELELTNSPELWDKVEDDEAVEALFVKMNPRLVGVHNTPVRRVAGADNYHEFMIEESDDEKLVIDVNGHRTTFKYFETSEEVFAKLLNDIGEGQEYMDDPDINCFCIGELIWIMYDEDNNRFAVSIG